MRDYLAAAMKSATDTQEIVISGIGEVADVFDRHFPGSLPIIIADTNTFEVAGAKAEATLRIHHPGMIDPVVLPGKPRLTPEESLADDMAGRISKTDAIPVAVGSGTINDIVKLASHRSGRPYMVVATAASMDGYASFGAAMIVRGRKTTIPCPAPRVVIADPEVLLSAPLEMTSAGFADLVGKITAGADWIIADALGIEPIDYEVWGMVQNRLSTWIDKPDLILERNAEAVTNLFSGLAISALAMQAYQETRPASGTEHLFSHVWEMEHLEYRNEPVSHGFKVGIGTLAASALLEVLFDNFSNREIAAIAAKGKPPISIEGRRVEIAAVFGETPYTEAVMEISIQKLADGATLSQRRKSATDVWDDLRRRMKVQVPPFQTLRRVLDAAGCPVDPANIGITKKRVASTFRMAQMIRPRYTALDLAYELDLLDICIDLVLDSGRYFE